MTTSRKSQLDIQASPFVHVSMRAVRRAFLFGDDPTTGKNYDHRKQWIVTRMRQLASVFAVDICAYAVMSNHYHIVLHVDLKKAKEWTDHEVVKRWKQLFKGHLLVDRWLENENCTLDEQSTVKDMIDEWRNRLADISWFMRCLNESIARQSNKEDKCKGRFWEGRFRSQALLDEVALLTCMTYVDLNPIRAKMAELPETSDFTSIQARLHEHLDRYQAETPAKEQLCQRIEKQAALEQKLMSQLDSEDEHARIYLLDKANLFSFEGSGSKKESALPFSLDDYIDLVDITGRIIREDKRGFIEGTAPSVLTRLGIDDSQWAESVKRYGSLFGFAAGKAELVKEYASKFERLWSKGVGKVSQAMYRSPVPAST